jgi:hypothetical protein
VWPSLREQALARLTGDCQIGRSSLPPRSPPQDPTWIRPHFPIQYVALCVQSPFTHVYTASARSLTGRLLTEPAGRLNRWPCLLHPSALRHMAAAVAVPSAMGGPGRSWSVPALDAAQEAELSQQLAILQQQYFAPGSTFPGLPLDPDGEASRAAAQG